MQQFAPGRCFHASMHEINGLATRDPIAELERLEGSLSRSSDKDDHTNKRLGIRMLVLPVGTQTKSVGFLADFPHLRSERWYQRNEMPLRVNIR